MAYYCFQIFPSKNLDIYYNNCRKLFRQYVLIRIPLNITSVRKILGPYIFYIIINYSAVTLQIVAGVFIHYKRL